ncbi:hypothetical protein ACKKBG_A15725 [Auxenochlorella protothecoides x Auxenochlorella symbiontica]|uniref:Uncharacterized protein C3orf26-like protein n=1 Tax=Auxenochlorella protothecoides TaxID=3075 RepID=A0A087SQP0_AUXPR|nr:Uncharacterized protein C3orf26-like protein [Auxenochlorella protothecoides]KFM28044.1 Uncharacterized protein C3orf26-like protein [Auxenochlorella protothecoides]RMZ53955.1 hypothetical protein APUTEX25_002532 [Auxenochlorella protothecoides]|eukprot:RMZ53955.1 hypothetical protein APUTEX25_002532 [Auxenochlorella protothecoides]
MAKASLKPKAASKGKAKAPLPAKAPAAKQPAGVPGVEKKKSKRRYHGPPAPRQEKKPRGPAPVNPPGSRQARKAEEEAAQATTATIAGAPATQQADWLWDRYRAESGASELERQGLTAGCFAPAHPSEWLEESLASLPEQAAFLGRGGQHVPVGSPAVLVVTGAAIRAVSLIRQMPAVNKACKVGKLFAKHFKQAEQEAVLSSTVMHVAVGTPNRLIKLIEAGALKLGRLRYVVVDVAMDAKKRTVLDMAETKSDFWTLFASHLKPKFESGAQFVLTSCKVDKDGPQ